MVPVECLFDIYYICLHYSKKCTVTEAIGAEDCEQGV